MDGSGRASTERSSRASQSGWWVVATSGSRVVQSRGRIVVTVHGLSPAAVTTCGTFPYRQPVLVSQNPSWKRLSG